jgi:hypothetical protein
VTLKERSYEELDEGKGKKSLGIDGKEKVESGVAPGGQ